MYWITLLSCQLIWLIVKRKSSSEQLFASSKSGLSSPVEDCAAFFTASFISQCPYFTCNLLLSWINPCVTSWHLHNSALYEATWLRLNKNCIDAGCIASCWVSINETIVETPVKVAFSFFERIPFSKILLASVSCTKAVLDFVHTWIKYCSDLFRYASLSTPYIIPADTAASAALPKIPNAVFCSVTQEIPNKYICEASLKYSAPISKAITRESAEITDVIFIVLIETFISFSYPPSFNMLLTIYLD